MMTDENGHYRVEVGAGTCGLSSSFGLASADRDGLVIQTGQTTVVDLELPHDAVVAEARTRPRCPGDPPGTIIDGHTTSQADLDAIAHAVLTRFAADASTLPDAHLLETGPVRVQIDGGPQRLGSGALPSSRFVARTTAELEAEARRSGRDVPYIRIDRIYASGGCAVVSAGTDFAMAKSAMKLCCCTGRDIYAKRGGRWRFVRRAGTSCA